MSLANTPCAAVRVSVLSSATEYGSAPAVGAAFGPGVIEIVTVVTSDESEPSLARYVNVSVPKTFGSGV